MGSLRTIGQGLNFDSDKLNVGIGSSFTSNVRLSVYNNNPNSWRTAIFKNTLNSDYLSIGTFNNNNYISAIANDNQTFKDLYINNLGNSSQPSSNIGNVIINGKTTIGIYSNNSFFNHSLDVVSQTSNIALFRNNDYQLSFSCNTSNITLNTNNNKLGIIPDTYLSSNIYVNGFIVGNNANFNNKVVIGTTINSFDGFPIITEYPLNVYGNIGITGNIFTTSDEKVKTNIKTIDNSLEKICGCRGVSFNYLNDSNKNQYGVIAQEIEKIIPDVVESNQYGFKNVNYLSIIGFLIEAIKELNHKISSNTI